MIDIKDLIGIPYKVHGRDKDGMDCYGLAIEVMKRCGITLPDVFYDDIEQNTCEKIRILNNGLPLKKMQKPCENCIIVMNTKGYESHIAVYLGEGMLIHSVRNLGVVYEPLRRYEKRVTEYYQVGE